MANIKLKELLEANVDPKLVARSKKTGKLVYFKSPEAKAAAVKAGSHEEPKKDKAAQAKQAKASSDMFKGDYAKDRGGEAPEDNKSIEGQTDDELYDALYDMGYDFGEYGTDDFDEEGFADAAMSLGYRWDDKNKVWYNRDGIDNDDEDIDTSDIQGKADPDADYFYSDDVYGATFKDPETGKTITVGDAYDREDDSPAYNKAFAYVAKFDPDKEVVMGHPMYGKKKESTKLGSMIPKK